MSHIIIYSENNYQDFEWFDGLAVIRFYADWCAPCVQNFPIFEAAAAHYETTHPSIKFGAVNVDQSPILTLRYQVYGLPSTLIFKQGQIVKRIAGVTSLGQLKSAVQQLNDTL